MSVKVLQVKRYNQLMILRHSWTMVMTIGNGSMEDKPRSNGYVVFNDDWAKWFKNIKEAELELSVRNK